MKNILLTVFVGVFIFTISTFAQTTKESTPSSTRETKEIQEFKEKLASKVAELQKKNSKAISGIITDNLATRVGMKTLDNVTYEVKIDRELTKIYEIAKSQKKEIKASDLKKGFYIVVSGPESGRVINANYIYVDERFTTGSGKVTEVNSQESYLKILSMEKDTLILDLEVNTRRQIMDAKTLEIGTVGLSRIKEGDTIHYVYKPEDTGREKNRFTAQKILVIPQEYFLK